MRKVLYIVARKSTLFCRDSEEMTKAPSSTKVRMLTLLSIPHWKASVSKVARYRAERIGERPSPWGTPMLASMGGDMLEPQRYRVVRFEKKAATKFAIFLLKPSLVSTVNITR